MPTKQKGTKKKIVKGWAVIQLDMLDSMPIAPVFNPSYKMFSSAVFRIKDSADKYAEVFKGFEVKVIPVEIHYSLGRKKVKRTKFRVKFKVSKIGKPFIN